MSYSNSVYNSFKSEGRAEGFAEGMAIGMLEARKSDMTKALQLRFQLGVPADLAALFRELKDIDVLNRWFEAALTAPSLDVFRIMMEQRPMGR